MDKKKQIALEEIEEIGREIRRAIGLAAIIMFALIMALCGADIWKEDKRDI